MTAATDAYREESDILKEFIEQNIVREKNAEVSHKDIVKRYKYWCDEQGEKPFSGKKLARLLRDRNYREFNPLGALWWWEIRLSDEAKT